MNRQTVFAPAAWLARFFDGRPQVFLLGFQFGLLALQGPTALAAGLLDNPTASPLLKVVDHQLVLSRDAAASVPAVELPAQNACADGEELDGSLCYPKCKDDYKGVGPVCWQPCPSGFKDDGAFCRKDAIITAKDSYGRGVGSVPGSCVAGKQKDGGLCYSTCRAGYYGVGPVCWESCKSGYSDHGATCYKSFLHWYFKGSYGRGVGQTPSVCPAGKESNGGLCYPVCQAGFKGVGPVCWKTCPAGFTDDGAVCRKDAYIFAKDSYGRTEGSVPPCNAAGRQYDSDYTSSLSKYTSPDKFTLIIASDPQLAWWRSGHDADCNSDDCVLEKAKSTNADQVAAMNALQQTQATHTTPITSGYWPNASGLTRGAGSGIGEPLGVIMNGDLTAYWHDWQVRLYREYYEPGYTDSPDHAVLQLPIFTGLGNHDYFNNTSLAIDDNGDEGSCYGLTADKNHCAKKAVSYIKDMIYCDGVSNFINTLVQRFDEDSLAYSWDIGGYHFVQMHNYPTYANDKIGIRSALDWLEKDLAIAAGQGRKVVLNFHELGSGGDFGNSANMQKDPLKNAEYQAFLNVAQQANVVAVFSGHMHADSGYMGTLPETDIPYFRSGASEYNTFLMVEFGTDYMNVGVIDSTGGTPKFKDPGNENKLRTFIFPAR